MTRLLAGKQIFIPYLALSRWLVRQSIPNLEVIMPLTVVLAVGLDSSLLARQGSDWKSAGYFVTSTGSIKEAISHLKYGDFDLVLLGHGIPTDSRERLAFLIRSTTSRTPVVCISESASHRTALPTRQSGMTLPACCRKLENSWLKERNLLRDAEPCRISPHKRVRGCAVESGDG